MPEGVSKLAATATATASGYAVAKGVAIGIIYASPFVPDDQVAAFNGLTFYKGKCSNFPSLTNCFSYYNALP